MFSRSVLIGATLLTSTLAWNTDVHNQIGFMAETFFTSATTSILAEILEPQYNKSVGRSAAWADAYAHTSEGHFSYQWHWIDTHDRAPEYCHLDYSKDCAKGGCVVSAIANQTGILRDCIQDVKSASLSGGTNLTCSYALKWIAHFFGDIHQPLHANGRAVGGNTYKVIFGDRSTQLHAVWDGYIPYFAANVSKPFSNQSIDPFFTGLVSRIRKDEFYTMPYMWLACSDPSTSEECATIWAKESNKWDCDYVYSRVQNNTDLGTSGYATGAVPIVELQISKAALRLGTWLNKLVEGVKYVSEEQEIIEL
ncbi:phospholipase C/P1 nuclease [Clathrospora elynae]|uniref:Phospholipase C/P1 nuclease n=1 Tax=Clathrospora elynae TaxID=706981 RepID=A0A6A5SG29_9PLEO|nr:phospholipase C/P1 nuclease [Clathrospora elynae]